MSQLPSVVVSSGAGNETSKKTYKIEKLAINVKTQKSNTVRASNININLPSVVVTSGARNEKAGNIRLKEKLRPWYLPLIISTASVIV